VTAPPASGARSPPALEAARIPANRLPTGDGVAIERTCAALRVGGVETAEVAAFGRAALGRSIARSVGHRPLEVARKLHELGM